LWRQVYPLVYYRLAQKGRACGPSPAHYLASSWSRAQITFQLLFVYCGMHRLGKLHLVVFDVQQFL
jgi:hypothetical protein